MAQLRRHCDKCKRKIIVSELSVRKGYFYCKKCLLELEKSYDHVKSDIFRDISKKVALQDPKPIGSRISVSQPLTTIQSDIDINKIFESNILTEQETNEAYCILEKRLAQQMLVQALGYEICEEKSTFIKQPSTENDPGGWVEVKKEVQKKHQPGNSQLFIMFMTNKFPDLWKVSKELIHSKPEGYDSEPNKRDRKKIESLARQILETDTDKN